MTTLKPPPFKFGRAPQLKGTETQLVSAILDVISIKYRATVYAYRNNTGATATPSGGFVRYGHKGSADIIGVVKGGKFLALECKTASGKPTPHQLEWLAAISALGGVAAIVRSVDEACAVIDNALASEVTDG
jgi:hypothetical protein